MHNQRQRLRADMSPKWRPQSRPILGQQLGNMLDRIEELERATASKAGAGGYGGGAGAGPIAEKTQAGQAATGVDGKVTVTFPAAFAAAPIVLVSVNNSGLDQLVAAVESISPTQCMISVGKIANQGAAAGERWTGPGEGHAHSPGNFAAAAHDHAPGTFAAAAHDHAPGAFSVTVPSGTDGSSGTFGVAGVSAQSGPHSVSGISALSGPHAVAGVSASESSHRHPFTQSDNVEHSHARTLVSGVLVYWIAMPAT